MDKPKHEDEDEGVEVLVPSPRSPSIVRVVPLGSSFTIGRMEQMEASLKELLDICARNAIDIPEPLRSKICNHIGDADVTDSMRTQTGIRRSTASASSSNGERVRRSDASHKSMLMSKITLRQKFDELDTQVQLDALMKLLKPKIPEFELHVRDGSYTIVNVRTQGSSEKKKKKQESDHDGDNKDEEAGSSPHPRRAKQKIETVGTANPCYKIYRLIKQCIVYRGRIPVIRDEMKLMDKVNLALEPGKMYLVLGAPGSGKSTLLKYIANTHFTDKNHLVQGSLNAGGIVPGKGVYWSKLVAYVDQIDRLHALLTVFETCDFAWNCRWGGTHRRIQHAHDDEADEAIRLMDEKKFMVNKTIDMMGLSRVKDTFVGDQTAVRGVSGGEKKRVTVAEVFCVGVPVICCDEISTGLDAATTYEITRWMGNIARNFKKIKIVSLLQPPPETVANFDEILLMSEGKIIYAGPVENIIDHFESLGYEIPERMDLADWLQALPTRDGWMFLKGATAVGASKEEFVKKHLDTDAFHEKFYSSELGLAIIEKLNGGQSNKAGNESLPEMVKVKFVNPWYKSISLVVKRELTLFWRNKYAIKAKIFQTLFMGVIVGTVFFQSGNNPMNVVSVLFQTVLYAVIQSMSLIAKQFPTRSIFYKHQDAHFFPTIAYVIGQSLANVPMSLIDAVGLGSMIFWFVGLAYNDGASIANYFLFMLILFIGSLSSGLMFGILPSVVNVANKAQAGMAFIAVVLVLFSGFTVQPDVIPVYYIWLYWLNFVSWLMRALMVNQYASGKFDGPSQVPGLTEGEFILTQFGFTFNGEPFTFDWVWYGIAYTIGAALCSMAATTFFYSRVRFATGQALVTDKGSDEMEELDEADKIEIPFKRVDLTFKGIHYSVHASTTKEKLELLRGVDGVVRAGQMTALMGSSGAGKTTLMDVLALRKNTGEVSGEVRLNGHLQEENSFRRCAGYVEQFDTQSPQLTIRETMLFSAKLRLDETDPMVNDETIQKFVNQTMHMLELTNIQDLQVGNDAEGGLSFEQRKRLSIGVELAANPSIIFLDEPTSGLDARAAALVMRGMKRIASTGRAVCATIHQPSIAVFNDFDALLLLKRGGEVVYHGEIGHESSKLIEYFERYEATPMIQPGENPATWMLTTVGAGGVSHPQDKPFDYAGSYAASKLHAQCLDTIDEISASATDENKITYPTLYATSRRTQTIAVLKRAMTVYYRSPSYNIIRTVLSSLLALLFSSVYVSQRVPTNESEMNSRINSLFIAVLFLCVSCQNIVLGVFETERNMYYRHKAANMYTSGPLILAFTVAEVPFVIMASTLFNILFYFAMGFAINATKFFLFFMFVTLGMGTYTCIGQMLISLFKDVTSAQALGGLIVTSTSLFSGIFIRPEAIPIFWIFMYWIMPGHYLFEGLIMSQFEGNDQLITASTGSPFYNSLPCAGEPVCQGTVWEWVQFNFKDFSPAHLHWDALYLVFVLVLTRVVSLWALTNINHQSN